MGNLPVTLLCAFIAIWLNWNWFSNMFSPSIETGLLTCFFSLTLAIGILGLKYLSGMKRVISMALTCIGCCVLIISTVFFIMGVI